MPNRSLPTQVLDRIRLLNGTKISGGELARIFDSTAEAVRITVKALRLQGHEIAGKDSDGGYWWAQKPEDLDGTIEKFDSLIESHAAVRSALKETQKRLCDVRPGELF